MSIWLARLKNQYALGMEATKPTKPTQATPQGGFVGFVAYPQGHIQKFDRAVANPEAPAADAPGIDPDRWCWPNSDAMNGQEVDTFTARLHRFQFKGLRLGDAEALADRLVIRDREQDSRRTCMECLHLAGQRRCAQWQRAGIGSPAIPADLLALLQHCDAFTPSKQTE